MNSEGKDIIKDLFHKKFENFNPTSPGWNEFEPKLKKHQTSKLIKNIIAGVGSAAIIIVAGIYLLSNSSPETIQDNKKITKNFVQKDNNNRKSDTIKQYSEVQKKGTYSTALEKNSGKKITTESTANHESSKNENYESNIIKQDSSSNTNNEYSAGNAKVVEKTADNFSFTVTSPLKGCAPHNLNFKFVSDNLKKAVLHISNNNYQITGKENYTVTLNRPGTYQISATVEFKDGKIKEYKYEKTVTVLKTPSPKIETNNEHSYIFAQKTDQNNHLIWNIGDKVIVDEEKIDLSEFEPGDYNVTLIETNNYCADTVFSNITVEEPVTVYMPNAFTPNNDGKNDIFKPVFNKNPKVYKFLIYDKFGKTLFVSTNPEDGWNGSNAKPGLYVWKLIYKDNNGKIIEKTGNVTLK